MVFARIIVRVRLIPEFVGWKYCVSAKKPVFLQSFSDENRILADNQIHTMKKGIHPEYRDVVFHDMSADYKFVTRSTVQTKDTMEFEGQTYPLVKIEVSSQSHPFYTGKNVLLDTAGRIDKFRKKYGK